MLVEWWQVWKRLGRVVCRETLRCLLRYPLGVVGGHVMWQLMCERQLVACLWRFWAGGVSVVPQGIELVR